MPSPRKLVAGLALLGGVTALGTGIAAASGDGGDAPPSDETPAVRTQTGGSQSDGSGRDGCDHAGQDGQDGQDGASQPAVDEVVLALR